MYHLRTFPRHHRSTSQRQHQTFFSLRILQAVLHCGSISLMDGVGILPPPARGCLSEAMAGAKGVHRLCDYIQQRFFLHPPESLLTIGSEYLRNRTALTLLYDGIKVHERTAEQLRESPPDAALAASHKSD